MPPTSPIVLRSSSWGRRFFASRSIATLMAFSRGSLRRRPVLGRFEFAEIMTRFFQRHLNGIKELPELGLVLVLEHPAKHVYRRHDLNEQQRVVDVFRRLDVLARDQLKQVVGTLQVLDRAHDARLDDGHARSPSGSAGTSTTMWSMKSRYRLCRPSMAWSSRSSSLRTMRKRASE